MSFQGQGHFKVKVSSRSWSVQGHLKVRVRVNVISRSKVKDISRSNVKVNIVSRSEVKVISRSKSYWKHKISKTDTFS